ncbi:MAG: hypothetical protein ACKON9_17175 [Planctomycetaceae bacterium]
MSGYDGIAGVLQESDGFGAGGGMAERCGLLLQELQAVIELLQQVWLRDVV